jgi:hypothetical protein
VSKLNDLLDATVTAQGALALQVESKSLTTVKRKLPKKEEDVDLAFQVTVCGAELVDRARRIAFGSKWFVQYEIQITLITPGDRDAAHNLADHANWRESTRARYMKPNPLPGLGVKRVEIVEAPFLDRRELRDGYDYDQVVLRITTHESRTA